MNQSGRLIFGIIFLVVSVVVISLIRINPNTPTPTRSTQARDASITTGLEKGLVLTQEFTTIKDYISCIDLVFTQGGRNNTNENTLVLLDANNHELYKENFVSTRVKEGDLTHFPFDKSIFVGKGKLLRLCIFSDNGDPANKISLLFNQKDSIGPLYLSKGAGNDLAGAMANRLGVFYGSSLMMRTYETDTSQFWLMKIFLYLLALIISCIIIWFSWVKSTLARARIVPEWIFLVIAIPVSMVFAFITPPLQVPDEGSHFLKANEIAEFHLFTQNHTSPVSILNLDTSFRRLHFLAGEKTSMAEIKKHLGVKLEPEKRATSLPPNYTLPYLPQALGIGIAKIFNSSPLTMMYWGRIFNLLISILIMFYAIRIIPQFKWIFLLLALMPKTLFLFGSLSYDSLTISLSFFTIAVFFYYAFSCIRNLTIKDVALMAVLVLLLLLCKPPYFLLGLLFFFIPKKKFGPLYKYIMISVGVVALALILYKGVPLATSHLSSPDPVAQMKQAEPDTSSADQPLIRPEEQTKVILNDIPGYFKLILKSGFIKSRSYILDSFVGLLGWIDVELPHLLTYAYLILLILSALILSGENVTLGISKKMLLFLILAGTFIIVETAMYVYATRPGRDQVFGVQGRYFIPLAPLFFMLFFNNYFNPKLNLLFSTRRKDYEKAKVKAKPVILKEIMEKEQLFDKSYYVFLTCFCVFSLLFSIYITLIRYYNI